MTTALTSGERTARDGRSFVVRRSRPTDARALARLFAAVRSEGRWLVTPPGVRSDSREAFYIGELIRRDDSFLGVAEAAGEVVGNVMLLRETGAMEDHVATLSICVAPEWRDVGLGSALVGAALEWARAAGLEKVALSVFPDNARAIAVYERAGFVREGLRRRQYRAPGGGFRDEVVMAWFREDQDR